MDFGEDKLKEFKPNSHKFKQEQLNEPRGDGIKLVKPKVGTRLMRSFFAGDVKDVKDYMIDEFLMPSIRTLFFNGITTALEMFIFDQTGGHRNFALGAGRGEKIIYGKNDYNAISRKGDPRPSRRSVYEPQDIFFEDKRNADGTTVDGYQRATMAFDTLCELFESYSHELTLGALYEAVGMTSPNSNNYTDQYYGWTNLNDFYITHERDGATLHVPRCVHLSRN